VIPEAGWLKNLMGSFDDPGVEVVGGNAFLDLSNLMGRAMALTWVFPPRAQQSVLKGYNFFYANNVAFRKSVSARFPFPKMQEGATRGSCLQLAENLKQNGIKIYRHTGAQVSHPPPNGWRHFIIRGIAEGRDELLLTRVGKGKKWFGREIFRVVRRFVLGVSAGFRSIGRQGKTVNISRREMPLVFGIVFIYWQCRLFGAFATRLVPQFMRNHFRI
jgi:hypothetical protein